MAAEGVDRRVFHAPYIFRLHHYRKKPECTGNLSGAKRKTLSSMIK
jgi:hypothetical protein